MEQGIEESFPEPQEAEELDYDKVWKDTVDALRARCKEASITLEEHIETEEIPEHVVLKIRAGREHRSARPRTTRDR